MVPASRVGQLVLTKSNLRVHFAYNTSHMARLRGSNLRRVITASGTSSSMANRASEEGSGVETRVAVPESKVLAPVPIVQVPGGRESRQLATDPPDTSSGTAIATIPGKVPV